MLSGREKRLPKLQDPANRSTASMSQVIPLAMALCASKSDALPDPAVVAKVVIGFARRKGIAMASIPTIYRKQLLSLCAAGNPTGLLLRDWLEGNCKLLDETPIADAINATGEGA